MYTSALKTLGNPCLKGKTLQRKNRTGLPDKLKNGMEALSGLNMDDVRVRHNSPKPATLQAYAYAQGTDIHIGPGQERHLPHEAWHVVQQKQGRVKPTMQYKGVEINDNAGLEKEADIMGMRALRVENQVAQLKINNIPNPVTQLKVGIEFQTNGGKKNVMVWSDEENKYVRPEHAESIKSYEGFNLETDSTDLEYVLKPVDETKSDAVQKLRASAEKAGEIQQKIKEGQIEGLKSEKNGENSFVVKNEEGSEFKIFKNGQQSAHPQVTMGVRLENIHDLIRSISEDRLSPFRYTPNSLDWAYARIGYGGTVSGEKLAQEQKEQLRDVIKETQSKGLNPIAKGFLSLVLQYIKVGKHLSEKKDWIPNAKNAMPVMSRTALNHIWDKMSKEDQNDVKKRLEEYMESPIVRQGGLQIKLEDWLNELDKNSSDLLSFHEFHSVSKLGFGDWKPSCFKKEVDRNETKRYLATETGKFGINETEPNDIGYGKDVKGAIVELRALQRQVEPKDWGDMAEAMIIIARHLNKENQSSPPAGNGANAVRKLKSLGANLATPMPSSVLRTTAHPPTRSGLNTIPLRTASSRGTAIPGRWR